MESSKLQKVTLSKEVCSPTKSSRDCMCGFTVLSWLLMLKVKIQLAMF